MTTLAPPPANSSAIAAPNPLLAPVTTTTASFKVPTLPSLSAWLLKQSLLTEEFPRKLGTNSTYPPAQPTRQKPPPEKPKAESEPFRAKRRRQATAEGWSVLRGRKPERAASA